MRSPFVMDRFSCSPVNPAAPRRRDGRRSGALTAAALAVLTLSAALPAAAQQTNLLTNNPSFEGPGVPAHGNGTYSIPGWTFNQGSYNWNRANVADGGATQGTRRFYLNDGGSLETAADSRASVSPGQLYELAFDTKKTRDGWPDAWIGLRMSVRFFDSSGTLIQEVKGGQVQHTGTTPWQTVRQRVIAPAGAAKAGVKVWFERGWVYNPSTGNYMSDLMDFTFDNFRFARIPLQDGVRIRSAPLVVERGKTAKVRVRYNAAGGRQILVRLISGATIVGEAAQWVGGGRGTLDLYIPVATWAGNASNYRYEVRIFQSGQWWDVYTGIDSVQNVLLDDTVYTGADVAASDPRIVYSGRIDRSDPAKVKLYWPGSQVRARFTGTSLAGRFSTGASAVTWVAVIDGDAANQVRFTVPAYANSQSVPVVGGLADGVHRVDLYKVAEVDAPVTFHGLTVDAGKGLLKAEPLPARRIEFYGDSITAGAAPDPAVANADRGNDGQWLGNIVNAFDGVTARALGADARIIAKGGTGVSGSWSGLPTLRTFWNKLDLWSIPYDLTQWTPQAVVIAIGHNDLYRKPSDEQFIADYRAQIADLRATYPSAEIFCINTTMSLPNTQWEKAVVPLLGSDPKLHLRLYDPQQNHGGHPRGDDHAAMALGNAQWWSLADWIEDTQIGWDGSGPATIGDLAP
jgi:lysophospholipase L1-like esterase